MKDFETLSLSIDLINLIVISVALIFYYRQAKASLKQAKETQEQTNLLTLSLERTTYIEFEASLFELSKLITQHPNVRPYLYYNKPCPSKDDENYNLVMSFCVFYLDFFDHVLTTEKLSPGGTRWANQNWENWIFDLLTISPSLRKVLNEEKHWYDGKLSQILEKVNTQNTSDYNSYK